jgi:C1A family cysteine protease
MKEEILNYGPIICGMDKSSTVFQNYEGGIIKQVSINPQINHYVEVVGHGTELANGEEYWIARNHWGTAWGEEGFFRIQVGGNNLGI